MREICFGFSETNYYFGPQESKCLWNATPRDTKEMMVERERICGDRMRVEEDTRGDQWDGRNARWNRELDGIERLMK